MTRFKRNYKILVKHIEHRFITCKPKVQKAVLEGRTKARDKMQDVTVDIGVDCAT